MIHLSIKHDQAHFDKRTFEKNFICKNIYIYIFSSCFLHSRLWQIAFRLEFPSRDEFLIGEILVEAKLDNEFKLLKQSIIVLEVELV